MVLSQAEFRADKLVRTGSNLPWAVATLVVGSIFAHGLSATPLTRRYGHQSST